MTRADDILFEPIGKLKNHLNIDNDLINIVKLALNGNTNLDFFVDKSIHIDTYNQIADLIENNNFVKCYNDKLVKPVSHSNQRPKGALTIKEIFKKIYINDKDIYFCAKSNGVGITKISLSNWLGIDERVPVIHLIDNSGVGDFFEWWVLGIFSTHTGYNQYYTFGNEIDANSYYGIP